MLRPARPVSRLLDGPDELHSIVMVLETLAVRSGPLPGPDALEDLRATNGRLATAGGDQRAVAAAEAEFHARLTDPCGNAHILGLLEDARRRLRSHLVRRRQPPRSG